MKINFYNYDLIGKKMSREHYQVVKFFEDNSHLDFNTLYQLAKEKFNPYGAKYGMLTIDTRTIGLLNVTKDELKSIIINDGFSYILNKDFKKIIKRLNNSQHPELKSLFSFFQYSFIEKSESISFCLKANEP